MSFNHKVLNSDKGMSLIEVIVASAVSIVVAMGVMKINESSQKGFQSAVRSAEVQDMKRFFNIHYGNPTKCGAPASAAGTFLDRYNAASFSASTLTPPGSDNNRRDQIDSINIVTGPGPDQDYGTAANNVVKTIERTTDIDNASTHKLIPGFPNWLATDIQLYERDGSQICHILFELTKKASSGSYGVNQRLVWVQLSCSDTAGTMDTCNASTSAGGDFLPAILNSGVYEVVDPVHSNNQLQVGNPAFDPLSTSAFHAQGTTPDPYSGQVHAMSVNDGQSVTFGSISVYSNDATDTLFIRGDDAKSLDLSGNAVVGGNANVTGNVTATGGNIIANAGDITATSGLITAGNGVAIAGGNANLSAGVNINMTGNISSAGTRAGTVFTTTLNATNATIGGDISIGGSIIMSSPQDIGTSGNPVGDIFANNYFYPSDSRYKTNVEKIKNALDLVKAINGVEYYYNQKEFPSHGFSSGKVYGVIAQDFKKIFPDLVHEDDQGYMSVNYVGLIGVLIEAIKENNRKYKKTAQEYNKHHERYTQEIYDLSEENKKLKTRLDKIEAKMDKVLKQGK